MFHDVVACSGGCGRVLDAPGQGEWICMNCEEKEDAADELARAWQIYEYYLIGDTDDES